MPICACVKQNHRQKKKMRRFLAPIDQMIREKDDFKTNLISSIIILVWQIPPNRLWLPRIEVQFFQTNVIAQIELRLNKLPSSYDFYS